MISIVSILISACGSTENPPITPAPDKLTYMYFYTEG
jgi:hypothetical protein